MAVERLKECDNIVALSRELGVHRRLRLKAKITSGVPDRAATNDPPGLRCRSFPMTANRKTNKQIASA